MLQFRPRAGILDLGWGHPDPALLPTAEWAAATERAVNRYGADALAYGYAAGPQPLVSWLCQRLGEVDGGPTRPTEVFVTAGASQALEMLASVLVRPDDTVLVDSPTYHLALRILADHAGRLVPVRAADAEAVERAVARVRADGQRVPLLYLVPTFGNPTGVCLGVDQRRALVEVAERTGLVVVEDDTYRELAYEQPAPPSIRSLAGASTRIARIGSLSKTVAPGLRLGWITADEQLIDRLTARGYVDSGGGVNHTAAVTMAEFGASGGYAAHVARLRVVYRQRRDALALALREHLPQATFEVPGGGWFLWVRLPVDDRGSPVDAEHLLPVAEAGGTSYLPGNRFGDSSARGYARLAYSMLPEPALADAVRRLASAQQRLQGPQWTG